DVRKEAVKELQVAFTVEDHHRDLMAGRPDASAKILHDDVPQQRGFSGSRLTENDALHDANPIRPKPWVTKGVVSKNDRILTPGLFEIPAVASGRNPNCRPFLSRPPALRQDVPYIEVGKSQSKHAVSG